MWLHRLKESKLPHRAALPSNEKAARLYAEGRARLWAFDYFAARDLLNKAIAADPDFPLAHAALSDVWWHTVMTPKLAWRLDERWNSRIIFHKNSSFWSKVNIKGLSKNGPKRLRRIALCSAFSPTIWTMDSYSPPRKCISVPADSLQTLAVLRHLPPPLGDDARIDMTEASAWINRDFTKARAAAKLAIEKATAQGSPVIVSRTYGILCQQEPSIDASTEAIDICRNALEASIAAKDPNGEAMMRTDLAALYYLRGDITQSAQMFQQAVKKFRRLATGMALPPRSVISLTLVFLKAI